VREVDVAGYLARLGVHHDGPPSVEGLTRLHRAHAERVPYTSLDIHLGRITSVDPLESADRVVRTGRAGYCFLSNGAFAALLATLGYDVRWHVGAVQNRRLPEPPGRVVNHLALTVHGLPTAASPDGRWLADVGLGDALHEPIPLTPGRTVQPPFELSLSPSDVAPRGWRLEHDALGSFAGMDFWPEPAGPGDFAAAHHELSSSPSSGFVQVLVVARRTPTTSEVLRGCVLQTVGPDRAVAERELTGRSEWFDVVVHGFGLSLDDVTPEERDRLWDRVRSGHETWVGAGRP
jgi:N-hydroxyarylamine O-acetyltransferase